MTSTRGDRVNISTEKHEIYKQLTEGPTSPFKTMKDLFLTSAAIGVEKGIRKPIEKPISIFAWSVFTPEEDIPLLYALVLRIGESIDILLEQGRILDLVEEYANTGIEELERDLLSSTTPSLTLVNKILEES